jgi:hypothetical protein
VQVTSLCERLWTRCHGRRRGSLREMNRSQQCREARVGTQWIIDGKDLESCQCS